MVTVPTTTLTISDGVMHPSTPTIEKLRVASTEFLRHTIPEPKHSTPLLNHSAPSSAPHIWVITLPKEKPIKYTPITVQKNSHDYI